MTTFYKKYIQSFFHNSSGNSANIFSVTESASSPSAFFNSPTLPCSTKQSGIAILRTFVCSASSSRNAATCSPNPPLATFSSTVTRSGCSVSVWQFIQRRLKIRLFSPTKKVITRIQLFLSTSIGYIYKLNPKSIVDVSAHRTD